MEIFQVATGIDLGNMQEQNEQMKAEEREYKKKMEEEKKQKEEEEKKKKEEEAFNALSEEEKQELQKKKEAEEFKNKGNEAYKAKKFEEALSLYDKALEMVPTEMTYFTNKAAVYFTMEQYEKCIEECDKAIELAKGHYYDYVKLGKALGRKANAKAQMKQYDEAIQIYKDALLEFNDASIKDGLKKAERMKAQYEAEKYIDPSKAEQHREEGNKLFQEGKFPDAIKEYTEGLRRDPKNAKIYSNRCFAYIKVMDFPTALKDAEKCLELDPTFVKAWQRKGTIHHMMQEYHKAIEAYDKGLKIDPNNKECIEGKNKTLAAISMGSHAGGQNDEERAKRAMGDPEIQALLKDPRIQQQLKDFQENPTAAQAAMRDPFIAGAINKLIAAGILKTA